LNLPIFHFSDNWGIAIRMVFRKLVLVRLGPYICLFFKRDIQGKATLILPGFEKVKFSYVRTLNLPIF
jgi:hypothetical protein